jgi:class 3 adenylate cyclase
MEILPVHWSILTFDVEGFSESYRDDRARAVVRAGFYRVLEESFHAAGLSWSPDTYEDRGDGAVVLVSPLVPKVLLIDPLLGCLCAGLAEHNRTARLAERFRLRCAIHAGEVATDEYGMSGFDLIVACRLLDAAELRASLLNSPSALATIVSNAIYEAAIRHGFRDIDPTAYHPVRVRVKQNHINAWLRLPVHSRPVELATVNPARDAC